LKTTSQSSQVLNWLISLNLNNRTKSGRRAARGMTLDLGTVYWAHRQAIDALRLFQNPKASNVSTIPDR
jgi:hypothetical protein